MIKCNECNNEIGSEASRCIYCGTKTKYGHAREAEVTSGMFIGLGLALLMLQIFIFTDVGPFPKILIYGVVAASIVVGFIDLVRRKVV